MKPDFSASSSAGILKMVYNFKLANCLHAAARLNIAELLYESPKSITTLAEATQTNPVALYRLLRLLASEGIFEETTGKVFASTPLADALHGDSEGSIKYYVQAMLDEHSHAFGNMLHAVQTGETAFDHYYKMDVWEFYSKHPEKADNFNRAMVGLTQYYAKFAIAVYDFNRFNSIVDVGGGNGGLLFTILKATDHPKGVVFDAPHVVPHTAQLIQQEELSDRCTTIGGDFFESVPAGHDLYLLKYILHDWNDEQSLTILRNCANAMQRGSKVLIIDPVIPAGNMPHGGKYMDVTMLACTPGRERTEEEFRELLQAAGLQFNKVINLPISEVSLVEGEAF